jgi:enoyl-CoA hydratase/carnithine racemase
LAEAIEGASADPRLRVIVLTGAGDRSFIGGANITEMSGFVRHHAAEGLGLTARIGDPIRQAPVPVIARINGYCPGAGLEIAATCAQRLTVRSSACRGVVRSAVRHAGMFAAAADRLG